MATAFNSVATILLVVFVAGLVGMFLDSSEPRRNLLIGATVFCSLMLTAFIWQLGIFAP